MRRQNWHILGYGCTVVLLTCLLCASPVHADAGDLTLASVAARPNERSDDDLLLFAVKLDHLTLCEDLTAYKTPDGYLLPLGALCSLVELDVNVDPAKGTATGTFTRQKQRFLLDVLQHKVELAGHAAPFDPALIERHNDDIYVDGSLLGKWLPLALKINPADAEIRIFPREPLPLQLRLEREGQHAKLGAGISEQPSYPRLDAPYHLLATPSVYQTLSLASEHNIGAPLTRLSYATLATGDLLFANSTCYFYQNDGQTGPQARLTLNRTDIDAHLLGPLGAREMIFGDTYAPALSLISPTQSGTGAVVSRYPLLQSSSQFGKRTFAGSTLPGWEVELYRDAVLLAYQQTRDDGRYEFRDVPLLFGINRFRLVFYGPHGERREEAQTYNVAQSLIPPGQFNYRLAMTQQTNGGTRTSWQQDMGLFNNISVNTVLATLRLADGVHQYLSTGLRGYWRSLFLSSDLASDRNGGWGNSIDAQTQIGILSLTMNHTRLARFSSEQYLPATDAMCISDSLRLDNIPLPKFLFLPPMSLQVQRQTFASHAQHTAIQGQISGSMLGLPLSNYYNWTEDRSVFSAPTRQFYGNLVTSRQWHGLDLRSEVSYDLHPVSRLSGLALSTSKLLRNNYTASLLLNRALVGKETSILLSMTRSTGGWSVGHSGTITDQGRWMAGTNLATNLNHDPRTGNWHADARALSNEGSLSIRVFFDTNGNGKLDPGEKPLKGIGFLINGSQVKERTNGKGIAFLQGYTCYSPLSVCLDVTTLEDPLFTPRQEGVTVIPRPGSATQIDIPVVATGEISGTVYRTAHGVTAPGIRLELLDARDKVIQTVRTAYDGYFVISKVPCGHYTLRIAPKQAVPANAKQDQLVEIPPEGAFVDGMDFVLDADK